ncbi:cell 5A endo-1,4-betaglucanase [Thraustotheca clavata]|uniref:Cell 5A endo-1,4-betaglucanase n=1 Tax=Thraustotheca clavata TaxID=74557 RepID=A0A1V9Z1A8_9STRA|nr:cell 5A endo-1,4-betaglucanase [Thraustotheca clavata]
MSSSSGEQTAASDFSRPSFRGSLAFTREDRAARFEIDVDDEDIGLLDPNDVRGTPIPRMSDITIDRTDRTSMVSVDYGLPASVDVNHLYSARQTVFEQAEEETKDDFYSGHTVQIRSIRDAQVVENPKEYKGRYRRWPGVILLLLMFTTATVLIIFGAYNSHDKAVTLKVAAQKRMAAKRAIGDGDFEIADDGLVNNPVICKLPNYISKNGKILAVSPNKTQVAVGIKGANWFGMETEDAIPFGLWQNDQNGTTVFDIAAFLDRNKFNSVRLTVCIQHILNNTPPKQGLVNKMTNRALDLKNYMTALQSIIKALAYRQITVLLSLHTLLPLPLNSGGLWYNADISEDDFLSAVDMLTKALCNDNYWNVIGLDLKNEPSKATWGTGTATDWQLGAQKIGNRMLARCPNWLAFVEGVYAEKHSLTMDDGTVIKYADWWGSGLHKAKDFPVEFTTSNKLVWAPHFYNPGVYPMDYFYKSSKTFEELDDETLGNRIRAVMNDSFGYLVSDNAAIVLGEFAGLYATDAHKMKTTKRSTDATINVMIQDRYAGGYMWSLNPESAYQYNPADTPGTFYEGLVELDWLTPNKDFLEGMEAMNQEEDKMASKIPATFKAITPFIRRAEELDRDRTRPESKMVAYYCRQYAMELGIKLRENDASEEATHFLLALMESLEQEKAALPAHSQEEGRIICENFAFDIFMRADEEDRAGNANKNTARTFYAAGSFFDILKQFGSPSEDIIEKTKYSKFKAADILKAIKEGRTPTPGAPSEQLSESTDELPPPVNIPQPPPAYVPEIPIAPPVIPTAAPIATQAPEFPNMSTYSYTPEVPVMPPASPPPPVYSPPVPIQPPSPVAQYAPVAPPSPPAQNYVMPEAPTAQPVPRNNGPRRRGGWSQNEINDALECSKFAAAALKIKDVELAIQRLEQALQTLR